MAKVMQVMKLIYFKFPVNKKNTRHTQVSRKGVSSKKAKTSGVAASLAALARALAF